MRLITLSAATAAFALMTFATVSFAPQQALAQATCRNKCNSQEQACLKRTNNKSQCGGRAQACAAKCK